MDQLRADILADMLLTGTPAIDDPDAGMDLGAIRAGVQVSVPVLTARRARHRTGGAGRIRPDRPGHRAHPGRRVRGHGNGC